MFTSFAYVIFYFHCANCCPHQQHWHGRTHCCVVRIGKLNLDAYSEFPQRAEQTIFYCVELFPLHALLHGDDDDDDDDDDDLFSCSWRGQKTCLAVTSNSLLKLFTSALKTLI